jgi:hypothetical protein
MMDPDPDPGGPKHMDPTDPDLDPPFPPGKHGKPPITTGTLVFGGLYGHAHLQGGVTSTRCFKQFGR